MGDNRITLNAVSEGTTLTKIHVKTFEFEIDEPELFGGRNLAPSPVDYLLSSIAGCIVAIGTYMAGEMGFEIRRLEVSIEGLINSDCFFGRSGEARSGFQEISIALHLDSSADEEQLREWKQQLPVRCPVLDNLLHPVKIVISEVAVNH